MSGVVWKDDDLPFGLYERPITADLKARFFGSIPQQHASSGSIQSGRNFPDQFKMPWSRCDLAISCVEQSLRERHHPLCLRMPEILGIQIS